MSDRLYHVSLRGPMTVRLMDNRESIDAFDASFEKPGLMDNVADLTGAITFDTVHIYRATGVASARSHPVAIRAKVTVPVENISGIVHIKPRN